MTRLGLLFVFLNAITSNAAGAEPVEFVGSWVSNHHALARGETDTLDISETLEVKFVRDFGGAPDTQTFEGTAKSVQFVDDILIIDFSRYPAEATYKLVLSVFENPQHEPVMYGTAYMYLDGALVSGLHLGLEKVIDSPQP